MAAALAANALIGFDQTAVAVALRDIHDELGGSAASLQWVITAYLLALAVFMISAGRLADHLGRKRLFMVGLVLFGTGSAGCAVAPSLVTLLVLRFVQGTGAALLQPLALAIVTTTVGPERRGWGVGVLAVGGTTFLSIGPLVAGAILAFASWRWIFLVTVPVVVASGLLAARNVRESTAADPTPVDWPGIALLLLALFAVVAGVTQLADWGPWSWALVAIGIVLLAVFVDDQRRSPIAFLELGMLRDRMLVTSLSALFAIQFVVLGVTVYLALYLTKGLGETALVAGCFIGLAGVFSPLLSITTGRLTDRWGPRRLVVPGLVLATAGLVLLALVPAGSGVVWLLPGVLVFGVSRPSVFTPASVGPLASLTERQRALASSLVTEARQLGAVLGVGVLGAVFTAVAGSDVERGPAAAGDGFRAAMLGAAAVTAAVAVVVARRMPAGRGLPRSEAGPGGDALRAGR